MLRDAFFIDDPMVDEVPRRNERQRIMLKGIMSPEEMQKVIIERFSKLPEMPEVEFVKAVDASWVSPSVYLWDFLTLKDVTGQGPIYITSVSKNNDNIDNCLSNDDDDDDDDLKDYVLTTKKENSKPFSTSPKPNCKAISNQPSSSKAATFNIHSEGYASSPCNEPSSSKNIQFFKPRQAKGQCPLCNDMFTSEHIEFHVATCGEKFSIILTDDEDDNDVTCHINRSQIVLK